VKEASRLPASPPGAPAGLDRVLVLLQRHGWNSTSFQVLEPGFRYWFDGEDACIAYVDTGRAWVVAGAPIAPLERFVQVTQAFLAAARKADRRVSCFGTELRFHETVGWPAMRIGDQPVWAPVDWDGTLARGKSLREQLRRARAKGVTVRRLDARELEGSHATRAQLDQLIARWLVARPMATMGFLVQVHPYTYPGERRCFIAERQGHIAGFLGVVPVYARGGWFFEDFLSEPGAPNGTIELLIDAGMRAAAEERVPWVTLGLVPLGGEIVPWLRLFRRVGVGFYDFAGLRAFKAKFKPRTWDPIYLSHPPETPARQAILDTLSAFSKGGLLSFGVRTLMRGPAVVMRALAVLLIPWTLVLALPMAASWFPSQAWRWGWVTFDIAICGALYYLSESWHPVLADVLATAITLDAVVTLVQAIAFDASHHNSPLGWLVIAIAVLAPTFASALLWSGRAHRRTREAIATGV